MNEELFRMLASFMVKSRRLVGAVNTDRLVADRAYALEIFQKVEDGADEDLVMLSLQLRDRLGYMEPQAPTPGPAKPEPKPEEKEKKPGKYMFGARS